MRGYYSLQTLQGSRKRVSGQVKFSCISRYQQAEKLLFCTSTTENSYAWKAKAKSHLKAGSDDTDPSPLPHPGQRSSKEQSPRTDASSALHRNVGPSATTNLAKMVWIETTVLVDPGVWHFRIVLVTDGTRPRSPLTFAVVYIKGHLQTGLFLIDFRSVLRMCERNWLRCFTTAWRCVGCWMKFNGSLQSDGFGFPMGE